MRRVRLFAVKARGETRRDAALSSEKVAGAATSHFKPARDRDSSLLVRVVPPVELQWQVYHYSPSDLSTDCPRPPSTRARTWSSKRGERGFDPRARPAPPTRNRANERYRGNIYSSSNRGGRLGS